MIMKTSKCWGCVWGTMRSSPSWPLLRVRVSGVCDGFGVWNSSTERIHRIAKFVGSHSIHSISFKSNAWNVPSSAQPAVPLSEGATAQPAVAAYQWPDSIFQSPVVVSLDMIYDPLPQMGFIGTTGDLGMLLCLLGRDESWGVVRVTSSFWTF